MVPDHMRSKVAQEVILCETQLNGLVVVKVGGTVTTTWSRKLCVWGEAGVIAGGKDSKTGDKGATMMFIGYSDNKSDSV